MSNNASGAFPSPLTSQTSSLAKRQVELLSRYFFSRKDAIAGSLNAQPPQPISATSPLEAMLLTHVVGKTVPTAKATTLKRGSTGFWSGHYRIGSYTPNEDGTTAWLCLDFDGKGSGTKKGKGHSAPLEDPKAAALHTYSKLNELGFIPYLELSGSGQGWHVWVFFSPRVPAMKARVIGYAAVPMDAPLVGGGVAEPHSAKGIEVFPKQNSINKGGYGNMVWLPWFAGNTRKGRNTFHEVDDDGSTTVWVPEDFHSHTETGLDEIIKANGLADLLIAVTSKKKGGSSNTSANTKPRATGSSTSSPEWKSWREQALEALDLAEVYGELLTGVVRGQSWLECKDPASPTGDRDPSAGVADGTGKAERGKFKSFRDDRSMSAFDFLVDHGPCSSFEEAVKWVADKTGVPLPEQERPELPELPENFTDLPLNDLAANIAEDDAGAEDASSFDSDGCDGEGKKPSSSGDIPESEPTAHEVARLFLQVHYFNAKKILTIEPPEVQRVGEKGVNILAKMTVLRHRPNQPEADIIPHSEFAESMPIRRGHFERSRYPTATTYRPTAPRERPSIVRPKGRIIIEVVPYPLHRVAVHIKEVPGVWGLLHDTSDAR